MRITVFIAWSGLRSRELAKLFNDWLPSVIHALDPFVSAINIPPGSRWPEDVANAIQEAKFGILCLTKTNVFAPWMNFETGALSVPLNEKVVCPIWLDHDPNDGPQVVPDTINQFQQKGCSREDIWQLVKRFNSALERDGLPESRQQAIFDERWPKFKNGVKAILANSGLKESEPVSQIMRSFGHLAKASRIENSTFQRLLKADINRFSTRCDEWSKGSIETDASIYNSILTELYESAQNNVFSTSIDKYLDTWAAGLGEEILKAHRQAKERNPMHVVERVFVFTKRSDVANDAIMAMDKQVESGVHVWAFFDDETRYNFSPTISRDFTIIDNGDVVGVTQQYGLNQTRAMWYFKNDEIKTEVTDIKKALIASSKRYTPDLRQALVGALS